MKNKTPTRRYYFTGLFLFLFGGYIILLFAGADPRPLEFLMGVLLFGMLMELDDRRGDENVRTR